MKQYTWEGAFKAVEKLNKYNYNGHDDWRVPSVEELSSIIDYTKYDSVCKLSDMVATRYWSATPCAGCASLAWYVDFYDGGVYYDLKADDSYVRAVRSGPNGLEWGETLTESHAIEPESCD